MNSIRNRFLILSIAVLVGCTSVHTVKPSRSLFYSIREQQSSAKMEVMIEPYKRQIDVEMKKVIGESEVEMPKQNGMPETLLGNFVADLVLAFGKSVDAESDFAVLNNGGLRSSLPQGEINIGNVYELMPFDNELVIIDLPGEQLLSLFSYIAGRTGVPVSGITMKLEKMNGNYVATHIYIGGEKFEPTQSYKVVTSDYLAGGGDNMQFFAAGTMRTTGKKIRDAIIDFIRLQTDNHKKLTPVLDNRITLVN